MLNLAHAYEQGWEFPSTSPTCPRPPGVPLPRSGATSAPARSTRQSAACLSPASRELGSLPQPCCVTPHRWPASSVCRGTTGVPALCFAPTTMSPKSRRRILTHWQRHLILHLQIGKRRNECLIVFRGRVLRRRS